MITYDWNCKKVDAYPQDGTYTDLVYNVNWIVTGVSDVVAPPGFSPDNVNYAAEAWGSQMLDVSDVTDFIPFEDLTNEMVAAWVQGAMGAEQVTSIEEGIATQIEELINPESIALTIGEPVPSAE